VEKEAGTLIQRDSSGVSSLLDIMKEYIKKKYNKTGNVFLGLVHRLDRPVSGIVVFARTSKAARRLHQEFAQRRVFKIYAALVENGKSLDREIWLERKDNLVKKRGYSEPAGTASRGAKSAGMRILRIKSDEANSLILVHLMTGRKHQIRAQLAAMGMPVVGDEKYGSRQICEDASICLHALYLKFIHPTKKTPVEITTPLPVRFSKKIIIDRAIRQKITEAILLESEILDMKQ
jgi:23S rRNA pseudouridine1911/1915/1917 synthase